jgi:hypothetical protein
MGKELTMNLKARVILLFTLIYSLQGQALDLGFSNLEKEQKVWAVNLGGMAFITAWGLAKWDYFDRSPHAQPEGWFGQNTDEGGADKIGHLWSTYTVADALAHTYEGWGYEPEAAAVNGAWSSFAIMGFMELGDSFSSYGFSYEDMLMNTAGAAASYLFFKYPELDKKLDLRWEYKPNPDETDFFTDYQHSKYLVALQLDGFDQLNGSPLEYLELHAGYYIRGFDEREPDRERNLYVGIGVDVGKILTQLGCGSFCTMFHYYQAPYTYGSVKSKL